MIFGDMLLPHHAGYILCINHVDIRNSYATDAEIKSVMRKKHFKIESANPKKLGTEKNRQLFLPSAFLSVS